MLSFSTTVSVALDLGTAVLPYRWRDAGAFEFARRHDAYLAVGRSQSGTGGISLSPRSLRSQAVPPPRLVLPSPNGSTIAHHLAATGVRCIAGCLRNTAAVASWLDGRGPDGLAVAVIAAGERWPDGGLRPAVEDAWGAGALIAELGRRGWTALARHGQFGPAPAFVANGKDPS